MPEFTSKTSTDPGPFDALHPAAERGAADPTVQQGTHPLHPLPDATDEDAELDSLFRFQEIPVSAEMRRELLGAKLPLASADQLADTQPPYKSSLSAPAGAGFVDRHGPTEPALLSPQGPRSAEPPQHEPSLPDRESYGTRDSTGDSYNSSDSYSTTAPTLLSVRRRRLRNRRLVLAALGAMLVAMLSGVAWRRHTRPPGARTHEATAARDAARSRGDRAKAPRIAGNRPASAPAARGPETPARGASEAAALPAPGSPLEPALDQNRDSPGSETANLNSQSAQLSLPATDATSSPSRSADSRLVSRDAQRANASNVQAPKPASGSRSEPRSASPTPIAVPRDDADANRQADPAGKPPKSKAFDPEELIF